MPMKVTQVKSLPQRLGIHLRRLQPFTSPGLDPGVLCGWREEDAPVKPGQGDSEG
jgi:hypothetical protein